MREELLPGSARLLDLLLGGDDDVVPLHLHVQLLRPTRVEQG
jgi:hypothetical protein